MPLKCPSCKRRYVDDHVFCEDCGVSLVPAGPTWRKWAILGLGAVLVVAAVWSGLSYVESDVRDNVSIEPESGRLPDYVDSTKTVGLTVRIQNRSMVDLTVDSLTCHVAVAGVEATCDDNIAPLRVPKGSSEPRIVSLRLSSSDPVRAPFATAIAHVHAWGIPITSNFEFPGLSSVDPNRISAMFHRGTETNVVEGVVASTQSKAPRSQPTGSGRSRDPNGGFKAERAGDKGNGLRRLRDDANDAKDKLSNFGRK